MYFVAVFFLLEPWTICILFAFYFIQIFYMPFIVYRNGEALSRYWRYNQPLANCRRRLVYDETTEAKTTLFENRQQCINSVFFSRLLQPKWLDLCAFFVELEFGNFPNHQRIRPGHTPMWQRWPPPTHSEKNGSLERHQHMHKMWHQLYMAHTHTHKGISTP